MYRRLHDCIITINVVNGVLKISCDNVGRVRVIAQLTQQHLSTRDPDTVFRRTRLEEPRR